MRNVVHNECVLVCNQQSKCVTRPNNFIGNEYSAGETESLRKNMSAYNGILKLQIPDSLSSSLSLLFLTQYCFIWQFSASRSNAKCLLIPLSVTEGCDKYSYELT